MLNNLTVRADGRKFDITAVNSKDMKSTEDSDYSGQLKDDISVCGRIFALSFVH